MKLFPSNRQLLLLFPLSLLINGLLVSCAETKFTQCKKIIEITMEIANETRTLSDNGKSTEPQEALQVADAFEEAAQKMEETGIQDEQLQQHQSGFANMYLGMSQSTRDFIAALREKDVDAAQAAKQRLQELGKTERKLVEGVNSYCQSE